MLENLQHIDRDLFLCLNNLHSPFFDALIYYATGSLLWIPLYLFFLYFIIRKYGWQTLTIVFFAALLILITDQTATIAKDHFQRLRPSNDPSLPVIHIVNGYRGGAFGFYSGHAANTFGVAFFLFILAGKEARYVFYLVLAWAVIMSYTRIYLGVHYPGDIIAGALMGMIDGILIGKLCLYAMKAISEKKKK